MKSYRRLMLGAGSKYADECFKGNFIGLDYDIDKDLTPHLHDDWRQCNKEVIPQYHEKHPDKSKIAAGLACGALWVVCKGMKPGDIVFCPNDQGNYYVAEIESNYEYRPGEILPHRRKVKWYPIEIERSSLSEEFRKSTSSGVIVEVSQYAEEI